MVEEMIGRLKTIKVMTDDSINIEFCVCCGKKTKYRKDDPIQKRIGYIPGSEQLCYQCYKELYPNGTVNEE